MSEVAVSQPAAEPTPPPETETEQRRPRRWLREAVEVGGIALILYLVIWSLVQTVRVEGDSMVSTLHTGDLLLASKISYHLHDPERGDIVILNPPEQGQEAGQRDFIKRVIGIPGDVLLIDSTRTPTIIRIKPGGSGPWHQLSEPYITAPWQQQAACCDPGGHADLGAAPGTPPVPLTIPKDRFFVMGDNRNYSKDSRAFGLVAKDSISAKAFLRLWPADHLGGLSAGPALVPAVLVIPWGVARRRRRLAAALDAA